MLVRQIMSTPVTSVLAPTTVTVAADLLMSHRFTALPVVDSTGVLIGIVTEADVIRTRFAPISTPATRPATTVGDVMTTAVIAVHHDANAAVLARTMLEHHLRCVPIVDGDKVVGVATRRDLIRVTSRADDIVAREVLANLQVLGSRHRWTVMVRDGIAEITDEYDTLAEHRAAELIAAAVPGVLTARVTSRRSAAADESVDEAVGEVIGEAARDVGEPGGEPVGELADKGQATSAAPRPAMASASPL